MKCPGCGKHHADRLELELDMNEGYACLTLTHNETRSSVFQLRPEVAAVLTLVLERAANLEEDLLKFPEKVRDSIPMEAVENYVLHGRALAYGELNVAAPHHTPKKESELN